MFTAGMQFDLGEDVNALRDSVHRWAQDRLRPIAAEVDRSNAFPNALWPEMGAMGVPPGAQHPGGQCVSYPVPRPLP